MNERITARALLGLTAIAFGGACGGDLATELGDGGPNPVTGPVLIGKGSSVASPGSGGPPAAPTGNVGSSGGPWSSGSSSSGSWSSGSSSSGSSSGANEDDAAACSASLLSHAPGTALGTCWSCIVKNCLPQVNTCMEDCACDESIAGALNCSDTGAAATCFLPAVSSGDNAETALGTCIIQSQGACPCDLDSGAPSEDASTGGGPNDDASTGCVVNPGQINGMNEECTSSVSETCGSSIYQVVCACPSGNCVCFDNSSSRTITFSGCPSCPGQSTGDPASGDALFDLCGFPR